MAVQNQYYHNDHHFDVRHDGTHNILHISKIEIGSFLHSAPFYDLKS